MKFCVLILDFNNFIQAQLFHHIFAWFMYRWCIFSTYKVALFKN